MKRYNHIRIFTIGLSVFMLAAGSLTVFAREEEPVTLPIAEPVVESIETPSDAAGFSVYELTDEQTMHTALQTAALLDDIDNIKAYGEGLEENSKPQGVVIRWMYDGEVPDEFVISLSENEDMSDAAEYVCEADADENMIYSFALKNLYLMKTYYYTICAEGSELSSDIHSFTTACDVPRNLDIDGVTNVRDMGGWPLEGGGYERQGMIYRGAKFNKDESEEPLVTPEGITTLKDVLHIRSELDFRTVEDNENGGITKSVLGDDVNYYSMPWSASSISKASDMIRDIMVLFSDENNYPIYFHCSIGTDRTGFIAVLIHGLLGVSEDDIYRDYVFSDLGVIETAREAKNMRNRVEKNIKVCEGETFQEQVQNYLLGIGVTREQIDSIIDIMTVK